MATYNKTKTGGSYQVGQLQQEINADAGIVPSCLSVAGSGENLVLEFAAALSAGEETTLDALILAHVPNPQSVDVDQLPLSELDDTKLAVHASQKPYVPGIHSYAVWTGSGDDIAGNDIGDGPLVHLDAEPGTPVKTVDVEFLANAGRVWIHEGYLKFDDGGEGDYMSSDIVARATPLQTSTDLDYNIVDDWLVYAGPGAGTHGLAGQPVLCPRTYAHDGDWNYDGTNLTPAAGDGEYKITTVERIVHRYINRIPCSGSSYGYFTMSSNETTELPQGYFMRISQHNVSDTVWHASVIMELYRERTHDP